MRARTAGSMPWREVKTAWTADSALVQSGKVTPEQLAEMQHSTGDIPDLGALPSPIRALYEASFGEAVGHLFLSAAPFAILAFLCILFIKEVPLRTTLGPSVAETELEAGSR